MKTWMDIFKKPFHNEQYVLGYIWDHENHLFMHLQDDEFSVSVLRNLVHLLNNEPAEDGFHIQDARYVGQDNGSVYVKHNGREYQICIRGWGYMTGTLNMSNSDAAHIQDEAGEWIVEKLKIYK